jgi:hypothetical protein
MDISNFRCPICIEIYGDINLPCTLNCGHSCCISHLEKMKDCPLCKHPIKNQNNFKENSFLRQMTKEFIFMNKELYVEEYKDIVHQEEEKLTQFLTDEENKIVEEIEDCNFDITGLQDKITELEDKIKYNQFKILDKQKELEKYNLSLKTINEKKMAILSKKINDTIIIYNHDYKKKGCMCNYLCSAYKAQKKCCYCLDKRPIEEYYEEYIDGKGNGKTAKRNKYYCPTCSAT